MLDSSSTDSLGSLGSVEGSPPKQDHVTKREEITDGSQIMSQLIHFKNYAIFLPEKGRREIFSETIERNMNMHIRKFPQLEDKIREIYALVHRKKVLPSMRSLQFGGAAIEENNIKLYNCCYMHMNTVEAFWEVMFNLLCGTGVGYSVRKVHVNQLPPITRGTISQPFVIPDTIQGWALALRELVLHHFKEGPYPEFDFSLIRPKGAPLKKSGGKAPGPEPLRLVLIAINELLSTKQNGDRLRPYEVHTINCKVADCVLSGGIRRSSLLCLFDFDDEELLFCKTAESLSEGGKEFLYNANNSVAIDPNDPQAHEKFKQLWDIVEKNKSGDPAVYFVDDDHGTNPCGEIYLEDMQFCNLTEVNVSDVDNQEELERRVKAASFLGTLQASYTDFPFLRPGWRETTQRDALLGVSLTGIATGQVLDCDLKAAARCAKDENRRVAQLIGINCARRITTVKPSGTASLIIERSGAGIHPMHAAFFKRRIQVNKVEAVYVHFKKYYPKALMDIPNNTTTVAITQALKAPPGARLRNEGVKSFLERVDRVSRDWIHFDEDTPGEYHNISATASLNPEDWSYMGAWIWERKNLIRGITAFPVPAEPTEEQKKLWPHMPQEDCTEAEADEIIAYMKGFDVSKIKENADHTQLETTLVCSGERCERITL
jgi:ribonucleoside-triphosphate reductase